jgi:hypothetical protein
MQCCKVIYRFAAQEHPIRLAPATSIQCASYTFDESKWAVLCHDTGEHYLIFVNSMLQFDGYMKTDCKYEHGQIFLKCFMFTFKQLRVKTVANRLEVLLPRLVQLLEHHKEHSITDAPNVEPFPFYPTTASPYGTWPWKAINFFEVLMSAASQICPVHFNGASQETEQTLIFTYR